MPVQHCKGSTESWSWDRFTWWVQTCHTSWVSVSGLPVLLQHVGLQLELEPELYPSVKNLVIIWYVVRNKRWVEPVPTASAHRAMWPPPRVNEAKRAHVSWIIRVSPYPGYLVLGGSANNVSMQLYECMCLSEQIRYDAVMYGLRTIINERS